MGNTHSMHVRSITPSKHRLIERCCTYEGWLNMGGLNSQGVRHCPLHSLDNPSPQGLAPETSVGPIGLREHPKDCQRGEGLREPFFDKLQPNNNSTGQDSSPSTRLRKTTQASLEKCKRYPSSIAVFCALFCASHSGVSHWRGKIPF